MSKRSLLRAVVAVAALCAAGKLAAIEAPANAGPSVEWEYHRTDDASHPNGYEQTMLWLMNRARAQPLAEGVFLADSGNGRVENAIEYFAVDLEKMKDEFEAIPSRPPAAFDRRIYEASRLHSLALIERDAQDHDGQFELLAPSGFYHAGGSASVFSYAHDPLYTHAAFNIDWGHDTDDGMQIGRGHRVGLMSSGSSVLTNTGIAAVEVDDPKLEVGPQVVSIIYARASSSRTDHYNKFLVGTVWVDANANQQYDSGEGLAGVQVMPNQGNYFAVTGDAGGYAIPVSADGSYTLTFSGAALDSTETRSVEIDGQSALVAWLPFDVFEFEWPDQPSAQRYLPFRWTETPAGFVVSWLAENGESYTLERSDRDDEWSADPRPISTQGEYRSFTIGKEELGQESLLLRIAVSSADDSE